MYISLCIHKEIHNFKMYDCYLNRHYKTAVDKAAEDYGRIMNKMRLSLFNDIMTGYQNKKSKEGGLNQKYF